MILTATDDRIKYEVCWGSDYYITLNYSRRNSKTFCQTPEQMVFIAILISMLSVVGGLFLSAFL